MYYRITYRNIGIYEALKNSVSLDIWKSLLNSRIFSWLPKPPEYLSGYYSYFTELGFNTFKILVMPICERYLNKDEIKIDEYVDIVDEIVYRDEYQVVVSVKYRVYESKFNELYLKIINEYSGSNYNRITAELVELCPIKHEYLNRYRIVDETVKSSRLTPVPIELIEHICDNIIKVNVSTYRISYKKICDIVNGSRYIEADKFRQNLVKYVKDINGELYILFVRPDYSDDIVNNSTFGVLQGMIDSDEKVCDFYNEILRYPNTIKGLTVIKHYFELEEYRDSLIFVNKDRVSEYFQLEDILDHELTHFIQRITGFAEDITNVIVRDYSKGLSKVELGIVDKFCNSKEEKEAIKSLIFDKCRKSEIIETQKDIINLFKRLYIIYGEGKDRSEWLEGFLKSINNYSIFEKYDLYNRLREYLNSKDREESFGVTFVLISICYLVIRNEYTEYDIDGILKEEFKEENF